MSVDLVLRAIATLSCMYTAGLFITLTSIAALNAAGTSLSCGPAGCLAAIQKPPPIVAAVTPIRAAEVVLPARI